MYASQGTRQRASGPGWGNGPPGHAQDETSGARICVGAAAVDPSDARGAYCGQRCRMRALPLLGLLALGGCSQTIDLDPASLAPGPHALGLRVGHPAV